MSKARKKSRSYEYPDDYDDYGGYDYYRFPKSQPLNVESGIKLQSRRGATGGSNWWARRWIAILESFQIGARLGRGRAYARKGQVISIDITKGTVLAEVQGSQSEPYSVKIDIKQIPEAGWRKIIANLSGQALFTARLLAGQMPNDIESAFAAAKLSLFPERLKDITTDCSCPDWSNPCKHIAAVYYLLGEEFDRDPFLIFRLRGLDREQLVAALELVAGAHDEKVKTGAGSAAAEGSSPAGTDPFPVAETLGDDTSAFWDLAVLPEDFFGNVTRPSCAAALVKSMGDFPFWRASQPFMAAMEKSYAEASRKGLALFLGDLDPTEK